MAFPCRILCLLFLLAGISSLRAQSTATAPAASRINAALQRSAACLLDMDPKNLDDLHRAMILAALLDAAPSLDSPRLLSTAPSMADRIAKVIAFEPTTLQAAAWQIHALSLLPDHPETRIAIERAAGVLIKDLKADLTAAPPHPGASALSPDDLHLAVAALQLAASDAVDVPPDLWKELEKVCSPPDPSDAPLHALPAADTLGLRQAAALGVTQLRIYDALHADQRKTGEDEKAIAPTLARVRTLYKLRPSLADAAFPLADLLLFTGQQRLAGALWLPALNDELLTAQKPDGAWSLADRQSPNQTIETTTRAMLVLARANAPVAICKFSYDGQWNQRPRDAANITAWLSNAFGRPLRWQVVSTADDPAAWNLAPILFMTGGKDPRFAPDTLIRLRDYANQGGLILSSADDRSSEFTAAITTHWATAAFENAFKPRDLPEDHPLFSLWGKLSSTPPHLESISNNVRELWIHSYSDLGATWHGRRLATRDQWTLAANLLLYTTGRENMRAPPIHLDASPVKPALSLRLARITYTGNWNPEPRLSDALTEQARAYQLDLQVIESAPADLDPKNTPVAHLTGAGALQLTDPQIAALKKFIDAGGLLIVDAAGGNEAFKTSFAPLVEKLTPGKKLEPLPLNHPIYNGAIPGTLKTSTAHFRKITTAAQGHVAAPRLEASVDEFGRPRILFSGDDLTCGIVGITTWGVFGYDESFARALMRNMLLYAAHGGRTPETLPTASRQTPGPR